MEPINREKIDEEKNMRVLFFSPSLGGGAKMNV